MTDRTTPPFDPIAREYAEIAFGMERRFPGFIDAYFGPREVKVGAQQAPEEPASALLRRVDDLASRVAGSDQPESRKRFLAAQLRAMGTICRKLAGESIDYLDEVRACFDIDPVYTPETEFETANATLDALLPGDGDLRERVAVWTANRVVSTETARTMIDLILDETRSRTERFIALPEHDSVEIAFVSNQPWSGYNWYLGGARSRVDVNTDLPIKANALLDLITHEAYPGHHTEHALKDIELHQRRGYGEHAIQLINTPECVISEGIATLAQRVIFPDGEAARWQNAVLYPTVGLDADAELDAKIGRALDKRRAVSVNAAIKVHTGDCSEAEAIAYIVRYGLRTEQEAKHSFSFLADPLWRPYVFTYLVGRQILGDWLDLVPDETRSRFHRLLVEQLTPGQLRAEAAASAPAGA